MTEILDFSDVFSFFDGCAPAPSEGLRVEDYVGLVLHIGERLGLGDVLHRFNLSVLEDLPDALHVPVCAHLARENATRAVCDVQSLPPVVCGDGCHTHQAPHVHCLFCLRENTACGVAVELCDDFLAHSTQHMQQLAVYIDLLESEAGGDDMGALEQMAEAEGRHVCFIASAGTARCPIAVAYCTACDQLCPLVAFAAPEECEGTAAGTESTASYVTKEPSELVLARVLLACHVLLLRDAQAQTCGIACPATATAAAVPSPHIYEESWIFLPTPFLFGEAAPVELTEEFEKGALLTHSSAVLPGATLCGDADDPRLCVLEDHASGESDMQSLLTGLPPYSFVHAVIGFAMQWPSEEDVEAKVKWVLRQRGAERLRVRRRLVYVEDTDEWIVAHVFHHLDAAEREESVEEDPIHGIRRRKNHQIVALLPMTMARQYTAGEGEPWVENKQCSASIHRNTESEEQEELENCPYGLEARSVQFFAGMTALAKAMGELTTFFNEKKMEQS